MIAAKESRGWVRPGSLRHADITSKKVPWAALTR